MKAPRRRLTAGTKIQVALDSRERPMHTHHEKLVLVDGEVAFVGVINLTDAPSTGSTNTRFGMIKESVVDEPVLALPLEAALRMGPKENASNG